jgi:hypothetical protein
MIERSAEFNPRYVLYASVHGLSPEAMLERDKEAYPGGVMTGFMLWMGRRKAEFEKENPDALLNGYVYDHVAYDEFLERRAKELIEKGELG